MSERSVVTSNEHRLLFFLSFLFFYLLKFYSSVLMLVDGLRPKRCSNRDNATLMMPLLLSHFRLAFLRLQLLLKLMILKGGIFFLLNLKNQSCQPFISESSVRSHLFVRILSWSLVVFSIYLGILFILHIFPFLFPFGSPTLLYFLLFKFVLFFFSRP